MSPRTPSPIPESDAATEKKKRSHKRPPRPGAALLTVDEVDAAFGIPRSTLYVLIARGAVPVVTFPGFKRTMLRRSDVEDLITKNCHRRPA